MLSLRKAASWAAPLLVLNSSVSLEPRRFLTGLVIKSFRGNGWEDRLSASLPSVLLSSYLKLNTGRAPCQVLLKDSSGAYAHY